MFELPPCTEKIASHYEVPVQLVRALHTVEGGWPGAKIGPNENGTYDHGVMQINDWWEPILASYGISFDSVTNNACTNITIGVWILKTEYAALGNWPEAIASYNAGRKHREKARSYAERVINYWINGEEGNIPPVEHGGDIVFFF